MLTLSLSALGAQTLLEAVVHYDRTKAQNTWDDDIEFIEYIAEGRCLDFSDLANVDSGEELYRMVFS